MSKEFTAGPWRWSAQFPAADGRPTWSLIGAAGYGILSCDGEWNAPQGMGDTGNADLIESAPDLYAALDAQLKATILLMTRLGFDEQAQLDGTAQARAALAKARGDIA